jgi:hypothetical protein
LADEGRKASAGAGEAGQRQAPVQGQLWRWAKAAIGAGKGKASFGKRKAGFNLGGVYLTKEMQEWWRAVSIPLSVRQGTRRELFTCTWHMSVYVHVAYAYTPSI